MHYKVKDGAEVSGTGAETGTTAPETGTDVYQTQSRRQGQVVILRSFRNISAVHNTHPRAEETSHDLLFRLLLE